MRTIRRRLRLCGRVLVWALAGYGLFSLFCTVQTMIRTREHTVSASEAKPVKLVALLKSVAMLLHYGVDKEFPLNPELKQVIIYPSVGGQKPHIVFALQGQNPSWYCLTDLHCQNTKSAAWQGPLIFDVQSEGAAIAKR